jgi:hypothetical protein
MDNEEDKNNKKDDKELLNLMYIDHKLNHDKIFKNINIFNILDNDSDDLDDNETDELDEEFEYDLAGESELSDEEEEDYLDFDSMSSDDELNGDNYNDDYGDINDFDSDD